MGMTTRSARAAGGARPATPPVHGRLAEPLHRHALRLLRLLRREDAAMELSAARASALSVLVFGGPATLGALAAAEQVSAPTMTRLVQELEREGWVRRSTDVTDARITRLVATPRAKRLLLSGRDRRVRALARALAGLSAKERGAIESSLDPMAKLVAALAATEPSSSAAPARSGRRRLD